MFLRACVFERLPRLQSCEGQAGVRTEKALLLETIQLRRVHCAWIVGVGVGIELDLVQVWSDAAPEIDQTVIVFPPHAGTSVLICGSH